jgi:hypothetical protein
MPLVSAHDDETIKELAHDLSEQVILHPVRDGDYARMARKLYAAGWRKENVFASGVGGHE